MTTCGHCKRRDVTVSHVRTCSDVEQHIRTIGTPREAESFANLVSPALPVVSESKDSGLPIVRRAPSLTVLADTNADIEGVYFNHDTYYKVQTSAETGRSYAKRWIGTDGFDTPWQYVGRGPLNFLTLHHKVTAEQAGRFGQITGQCVFCSRKLTDERSIEVGYGAKCAENQGLPWGGISDESWDRFKEEHG